MSRLKKPIMSKLKVQPIRTAGILSALYAMALTILCLTAANAQQAPSSQTDRPPTLESETNLVLVRVIVRDSQGHPVTGLKKEDFKLFDRGKEQPITQFDEVPDAESATKQPSGPQTDEQQNNPQTATISSGPARLVAFYFDDLNAPRASLMQARDAADKFIATNLQPTDKVAIFSSEKMLTDFTADPARIHQAITQLNGSSRPGQAVRRCPDISEYQAEELLRNDDYVHSPAWQLAGAEYKQCSGRDPDPKIPPDVNLIKAMARSLLGEAQARARANLQQFEQVIKYISHLSGQRTILLVSTGFLSSGEQYQLDRIIDHALHARVVINALDPKGLAILMREQDASRRTIAQTESGLNSSYTLDSAQAFESSNVLAELTQGTGGRFFHNDNDLAAGFASLAGHPDEYTLAFTPKDLRRDGKFHELKVTLVNRQKGVTISSRRGYFSNEDAPANAEPQQTAVITPLPSVSMPAAASTAALQASPQSQQMDDNLRQALLANTDSTGLPISINLKSGATPHEISLLIHLDARALPFRKEGDHCLDTVTFAAASFDGSDKVGLIKQRSAKLNLTQEQLAGLNAKGIELTFTFPLEAGARRIRAVVTESEQHKTGSLSKTLGVD
jgi:VWFA-related protein